MSHPVCVDSVCPSSCVLLRFCPILSGIYCLLHSVCPPPAPCMSFYIPHPMYIPLYIFQSVYIPFSLSSTLYYTPCILLRTSPLCIPFRVSHPVCPIQCVPFCMSHSVCVPFSLSSTLNSTPCVSPKCIPSGVSHSMCPALSVCPLCVFHPVYPTPYIPLSVCLTLRILFYVSHSVCSNPCMFHSMCFTPCVFHYVWPTPCVPCRVLHSVCSTQCMSHSMRVLLPVCPTPPRVSINPNLVVVSISPTPISVTVLVPSDSLFHPLCVSPRRCLTPYMSYSQCLPIPISPTSHVPLIHFASYSLFNSMSVPLSVYVSHLIFLALCMFHSPHILFVICFLMSPILCVPTIRARIGISASTTPGRR